MSGLLENPAVQAGVAPLVAALIVAALLGRTRFAWLAIVVGYATMVALTTGLSFTPLTASRKIMLLALLAPLVGLVADTWFARRPVPMVLLAIAAGAAAVWTFLSVLVQIDGAQMWLAGFGILLYASAMVHALLALRDDPLRAGAAGLGLGLATGIAALISASIGFLFSGVAIATSAGALLLVWIVSRKPIAPGVLGTVSIGLPIALFSTGTQMLAQMPWYALAALLLIPLAVRLPVRESSPAYVRAFMLSLYALAAACLPIAAAWFAARSTVS